MGPCFFTAEDPVHGSQRYKWFSPSSPGTWWGGTTSQEIQYNNQSLTISVSTKLPIHKLILHLED